MTFEEKSSPENKGFNDSDIFLTPSKKHVSLSATLSHRQSPFDLTLSPNKSPSKRGVIKLEKTADDIVLFSPVKTPNGRAGLPSPKKRTIAELDKSARKRAILTSGIYSKLMDDDLEENNNEYLDRQEISLAEAIIKESRDNKQEDVDEYFRAYGSDVELEEDLTVNKKPKRRGRKPKKEVKVEEDDEIDDEDIEIEDDGELEDDDDEEFKLPKKERKAKNKRIIREVSDIDDISEEDEAEKEILPKRQKITASPFAVTLVDEAISPSKRKVGRPSKASKVIGKIKSIFQMDDEAFFTENKQATNRIKENADTSDVTKDSDSFFSMTLDNVTQSSIVSVPTVSGIPNTKEGKRKVEVATVDSNKFIPLPIPNINEEGEIEDEEYVKKYLPNVNIEEKYSGRLIDERAFFLDGTEGYFEQHMGRPKASANSLSQLAPPLEYDEFIPYVELSKLIRSKEKNKLNDLHKSLYHQWCFELTCGFSLNFYGVGSKIKLIGDFVQNYLVDWYEQNMQEDEEYPDILVVNGYNPAVKFKKVAHDILSVFISQEKKKQDNVKFPKHISETIPFLMKYVEDRRVHRPGQFIKPKLILVIHNIDGKPFLNERTQSLLSQLCSIPEIWLISSTDNINVSLLWDLFKLKSFNFLWHDLTTYEPYTVEMSFRDVLSMGKSKKFVGNKGAKYVLSSLTKNARNLYKILLTKQLEIMRNTTTTKAGRNGLKGSIKLGIEFKQLYNTCLEEFVTSNEISFRTMLGEFVEHKMCSAVKDEAGVEMVFVPFNFDEMEKLLAEEFASNEM